MLRFKEVLKIYDGGWNSISIDAQEMQNLEKDMTSMLENAKVLTLVSIDKDGVPRAKGMTNNGCRGFQKVWFCTNASSKRVSQLISGNLVTVYCHDLKTYNSLELTGRIHIETDLEWKQKCWKPFYEGVFRDGINDPDYLILRFEALFGNSFYNELSVHFVILEAG